ncbi:MULTISPECIES: HD domain-containing protein [Flavobacteriaceae]|uniref:HD domain-containing protein n=1 Tax=Flavobacteriaceae TaxID=49546 RepID=UPI001492772B|nr:MULTISPECIES: HD domain-containing protein [Allomuricauda]MDC6366331.1 HD domain-containing protein [Muricauda sp. AC10]
MNQEQLIAQTIAFVKEKLQNAEGGHDWFHTERVLNTSKLIAQHEEVDPLIVQLAAILHDVADAKFHNGDETVGPNTARAFLTTKKVDAKIVEHVVNIIQHMSFKNSLENGEAPFSSLEMKVVQDADRLDAIGAIGIARTFNYGGFKNRPLYDPDIAPSLNLSKEAYKKSNAPTINHFYEKLLLLKDQMNTETGKRLAQERHLFMLEYLTQFYGEWNGER